MGLRHERLAEAIQGSTVERELQKALKDGDKVWSVNRKALSLIDFHNDGIKGEQAINNLLASVKIWKKQLGSLKNAAKTVESRAFEAIRKGEHDSQPPKGSEASGSSEDISKGIAANIEGYDWGGIDRRQARRVSRSRLPRSGRCGRLCGRFSADLGEVGGKGAEISERG
jgi:hypothetical protein